MWNRKYVTDIQTEMFIYQSKVNLDEKILFGSIPHLTDPEIRKMVVKGMFWEQKFHIPFWSMIYLLLKFEFSIWQCKLQCHINQRPEGNAEFLITIQNPYKHFDYCWVLKMFDFTKQNFVIQVSL